MIHRIESENKPAIRTKKSKNCPLIALLLISGIYGTLLELDPDAEAMQLFVGLHLAGLGAMSAVTLVRIKMLTSAGKRFVYLLLQLISFRIAYFPVMVLSATVACYSEWLFQNITPFLPITIFPYFFIAAALMFAMLSYMLSRSINGEMVYGVLIAAMMAPMLMISFSELEDLTFLPDDNWSDIDPLPEVRFPKRSPYFSENHEYRMNPAQQAVALAGALLYPLIPNAPWSQAAKGTLEHAYRENPAGSSHDRLADHYAAFLAAHRYKNSDSKKI